MAETTKQHLSDLLASFDTAMLITRHHDGEHARPMAVAGVEGASTVWFVTSDTSPKADEIRSDARVAVTCQSDSKYAALSGHAALVQDRTKVDELWKESWKTWFPNGKTDPTLALIRVDVDDAEFWDNTGAKGVRYAFEKAKAYVKGTTPSTTAAQHGRVKESPR